MDCLRLKLKNKRWNGIVKSKVIPPKKQAVIWYPFFFAAYPVLGLLAHNIGNARPEAGIRPVAISILGAAILFGLLRLLTRDWHRAAFACTAWIALFVIYGHAYI